MLDWDHVDSEGLTVEQLPPPWRRLVERLEAHRGHPAYAWFDRIGNGVFEDDSGGMGLPAPAPVYRFRRRGRVAYVWPEGEAWAVWPWRRLRARVRGSPKRVASFPEALDLLARRLWWQFWG